MGDTEFSFPIGPYGRHEKHEKEIVKKLKTENFEKEKKIWIYGVQIAYNKIWPV